MTELREQRAQVFGEVADEYDRLRPTYPSELFDDVLAYAALDGRPALEVGAGTGKATVEFTSRGVDVTALEPDARMAALLGHRVGPGTPIVVSTFEDYRPDKAFGLLYSAQAWHWTNPDTRWQHALRALAAGGTIALFWNAYSPADPSIVDATRRAFQQYAPHLPPQLMPEDFGTDQYTELVENPGFTDYAKRLYSWNRTLSADDFMALLATTSAFRIQDDDTRARMLDIIRAPMGDEVLQTGRTALALARSHTTQNSLPSGSPITT